MVGENRQAFRSAGAFLQRFFASTLKQQSRLLKRAPLGDIQAMALHHQDAFIRRDCLFFLDHYANDASTATFAEALHDPVDFVRNAALHSIACESCRTDNLCVADVVPDVIEVLERDPRSDLRIKSLPTLLRLADRDERALAAIKRAAEHDSDEIVRLAAADALAGRLVSPKKRYERRQRRHARTAARNR
jgi:hypothetical protein